MPHHYRGTKQRSAATCLLILLVQVAPVALASQQHQPSELQSHQHQQNQQQRLTREESTNPLGLSITSGPSYCTPKALLDADLSGNNFVSRAEYVNLLLNLAPTEQPNCHIIDEWLSDQSLLQASFATLSCVCRDEFGHTAGDDSCCLQAVNLPNLAAFAIPNATEYASLAEYPQVVCHLIDQAINEACPLLIASPEPVATSEPTKSPVESTLSPTARPTHRPSVSPTASPTQEEEIWMVGDNATDVPPQNGDDEDNIVEKDDETDAEPVGFGDPHKPGPTENNVSNHSEPEDDFGNQGAASAPTDPVQAVDDQPTTTAAATDEPPSTGFVPIGDTSHSSNNNNNMKKDTTDANQQAEQGVPVGWVVVAVLIVLVSVGALFGMLHFQKYGFRRSRKGRRRRWPLKWAETTKTHDDDEEDDDLGDDDDMNSVESVDGPPLGDLEDGVVLKQPGVHDATTRSRPAGSDGVVRVAFEDTLSVWGRRKRRKQERQQRRDERQQQQAEMNVEVDEKGNIVAVSSPTSGFRHSMSTLLSSLGLEQTEESSSSGSNHDLLHQQSAPALMYNPKSDEEERRKSPTLVVDIFDDNSSTSSCVAFQDDDDLEEEAIGELLQRSASNIQVTTDEPKVQPWVQCACLPVTVCSKMDSETSKSKLEPMPETMEPTTMKWDLTQRVPAAAQAPTFSLSSSILKATSLFVEEKKSTDTPPTSCRLNQRTVSQDDEQPIGSVEVVNDDDDVDSDARTEKLHNLSKTPVHNRFLV